MSKIPPIQPGPHSTGVRAGLLAATAVFQEQFSCMLREHGGASCLHDAACPCQVAAVQAVQAFLLKVAQPAGVYSNAHALLMLIEEHTGMKAPSP